VGGAVEVDQFWTVMASSGCINSHATALSGRYGSHPSLAATSRPANGTTTQARSTVRGASGIGQCGYARSPQASVQAYCADWPPLPSA
jgi:hypothetical protein